jgi:hypothetical protein
MKMPIRDDRLARTTANASLASESKHDCDSSHEKKDAYDPPLQTPQRRSLRA